MSSRAIFIRVLVMRQGQQWLAQGLEYDLAAQGPSEKQAILAFVGVLQGHLRLDRKHGREPLAGIPPAPERFMKAFERLQRRTEPTLQHLDLVDGIPPAYLIQATAQNTNDLGLLQ